jgi:hypothetical protein
MTLKEINEKVTNAEWAINRILKELESELGNARITEVDTVRVTTSDGWSDELKTSITIDI